MNSSTPAIAIENLAYAYGRAEAVLDLNLSVRPGRCYGLFGRNGAGKTTTMKCLLNLLRPRRGQVRVWPEKTSAVSAHGRNRRQRSADVRSERDARNTCWIVSAPPGRTGAQPHPQGTAFASSGLAAHITRDPFPDIDGAIPITAGRRRFNIDEPFHAGVHLLLGLRTDSGGSWRKPFRE